MGLVDCGGNFLKLEMGHVDFSLSNAKNTTHKRVKKTALPFFSFHKRGG